MRNDKIITREDLKNTEAEEVENPQKLLEACVNSAFSKDGLGYPVTARFIRQTAGEAAIIQIRNDQGDEYFGTVNSLQNAYEYATDLDIFIDKQDNYSIVWEKSIFFSGHQTEVVLESLPPLEPETGVEHSLALSCHKRSRIYVDDQTDYIAYRVLYELSEQESVFVARTLKNKVYTSRGTSDALSARLVPGDFYQFQSSNDLLFQVYGMELNPFGVVRPAVSPVYVVPPQA